MAELVAYEQWSGEVRAWVIRRAELIEAFKTIHGLGAEVDVTGGAAFEVDGVAMSIRHDPSRMPFHLQVFVDFGPLPVNDATGVMRSLLESSFDDLGTGAGYAIAPGTGHVVCCLCLGLSGLDANGLGVVLSRAAAVALKAGA